MHSACLSYYPVGAELLIAQFRTRNVHKAITLQNTAAVLITLVNTFAYFNFDFNANLH